VGHAIRDKQLNKCRKDQKSQDTPNLSSVARPIQIWVEDREKGIVENPQSILGKVQQQGVAFAQAINSPICYWEAHSQRTKPSNKLTPLHLPSTGMQKMSSDEMNDVRIQNPWQNQNYQSTPIGDSLHSRFDSQEMTIKLLRHSRLESLRAMHQQPGPMDLFRLSIMHPISSPNLFPNSLLLQSKRKQDSLLAYLGFLNSMSPILPLLDLNH
jgi:hypothetical protein